MKIYQNFIKRALDIFFSFIFLLVLFPVFLVIVLLLTFTSKDPVFFLQKRVGIHKIHFNIIKFRTMRSDTPKDIPTHLLINPEKYITFIGKILRKTSLDEIPQLFQILSGKMSFIGPRPALWNQYDLIDLRDEYGANDIRPGLSGWAQVNGRDELTINEKAAFDGEYVNKLSFSFDIKCCILTFKSVLSIKNNNIKKNTDISNKNSNNIIIR